MKRYTIALAFCMLSLFCTAQEGWYIGVQANPFHYWMYNKQDFNKTKFDLPYYYQTDNMEPVSNKLFAPKGIGIGFSFGYSFYRNWGLSSGLGYSNQKYQFSFGNRYPSFWDTKASINENLSYIHLPVSIEGNIPISHFIKLYGSIGLQYSLLIDSEFLFTFENDNQTYMRFFKVKNKDFYHHFLYNSKKTEQHSKLAGNLYNTHLLGIQAEVGLQFRLGKYWSLHGAFTGSFDFINTERKKSIQLNENGDLFIPLEDHDYFYSDIENFEPSTRFYIGELKFRRIPQFEHGEFVGFEPRANTHNIRAGFRIELLYYFNP